MTGSPASTRAPTSRSSRTRRSSRARVDRVLAAAYDEPFDLVVLDPPREGAKRAVVEQVVDRAPRAVAYVACDPAALARDVAIFAEHGYRMTALRAFDLFPMTHHVECVALLENPSTTRRGPSMNPSPLPATGAVGAGLDRNGSGGLVLCSPTLSEAGSTLGGSADG